MPLATTTATRPQDARCCATGGNVIVELAIRGERLWPHFVHVCRFVDTQMVKEGLEDARAQQRYRDANKEKVLAKQRERRAADPVKTRLEGQKSMKRWKDRNPAGAP